MKFIKLILLKYLLFCTYVPSYAFDINPELGVGIKPNAEARFMWKPVRCAQFEPKYLEGLTIEQAKGRNQWSSKCISKEVDREWNKETQNRERIQSFIAMNSIIGAGASYTDVTSQQNRPYYGIFGKYNGIGLEPSNPEQYSGAILGEDNCDIPENYTLVGVCLSSCYSGDQKLAFAEGSEAIQSAMENNLTEIITLDPLSTKNNLIYKTTKLKYFIKNIKTGLHEMARIKTRSGKEILVTTNHPLLLFSGKLIEAKDLSIGMSLINSDGEEDTIVNLRTEGLYGMVYNVDVDSNDPLENIVVAEGLLNGAVYFQNEGKRLMDRSLFRLNLSNELFN